MNKVVEKVKVPISCHDLDIHSFHPLPEPLRKPITPITVYYYWLEI